MSESNPSSSPVPESRVVPRKRARISLVWVIPIVAAVAGVWIAVTKILNRGPEITIVFHSAEGLEAGKTKIRYSGLEIGTLTGLHLSDDGQQVIGTAGMAPKTEKFLVKDSRVWVVRPRVSGLNITGLGTLISGHYIELDPGKSTEPERHFTALLNPPSVSADTPGRFFTLRTPELGSIGEGTPIYFRRLPAGQVVSYELDKAGEFLSVRIFIRAPYDQYVTPDTRFWQASGVEMSVSAAGLRIQTESLMSILAGGIAFETPAVDPVLPPAEPDTIFTLFKNRREANELPPRAPHSYLLVFKQSVRGLEVGAPVEMGGVKIGEVTEISAQFDARTSEFSIPVMVSLDPQRYGVKFLGMAKGQSAADQNRGVIDNLVMHGLRAQLRKGSLLSGALFVSLDFIPDAPADSVDWAMNPPQIPVVSGKLEEIEATLASLTKKMDQMEFKEISADLRKTMGDLDQTLMGVRGTLTNTDRLLGSANQLIQPNSALVGGLDGTLQDVGNAARSLRVLADYLERHPEALIRGKTGDSK